MARKYEVKLQVKVTTVVETAYIAVEAADEDEAMRLAEERYAAEFGDLDRVYLAREDDAVRAVDWVGGGE